MILDERVRAALAATTRFTDVRVVQEVDSTNRFVAELAADGAPEGLVVAANFQTAGRGRLDRNWEARPGDGLLVSILLRPVGLPVERWHLITAAAALASQRACFEVARVEPEIKWPNDLIIDGSKLAGILAEAGYGSVTVGMGMNVHSGPPGAAVLDRAARRRIDRAQLLEAWLYALEPLLGRWEEVASRYRSRCATIGRDVEVSLASGEVLTGHAENVDDLGRLVVRPEAAEAVTVAVGDVTHVRGTR